MPSNLVKTDADETKWNRAKKKTKEEYGSVKWPVVTHIYENMKDGGQEKQAAFQALLFATMLRKSAAPTSGLSAYPGAGMTPSIPRQMYNAYTPENAPFQQYGPSVSTRMNIGVPQVGEGSVVPNFTRNTDSEMARAIALKHKDTWARNAEANPLTHMLGSNVLPTSIVGGLAGAGLGAALAGRKRRLLGALLGGLGGAALSYGLSSYLKSHMGDIQAVPNKGLSDLNASGYGVGPRQYKLDAPPAAEAPVAPTPAPAVPDANLKLKYDPASK